MVVDGFSVYGVLRVLEVMDASIKVRYNVCFIRGGNKHVQPRIK